MDWDDWVEVGDGLGWEGDDSCLGEVWWTPGPLLARGMYPYTYIYTYVPTWDVRTRGAHLGIDPTGNMDCIEHTGSEVHQ